MLNAGAADPVVVFSVAPVRSAVAYAPNREERDVSQVEQPRVPHHDVEPEAQEHEHHHGAEDLGDHGADEQAGSWRARRP